MLERMLFKKMIISIIAILVLFSKLLSQENHQETYFQGYVNTKTYFVNYNDNVPSLAAYLLKKYDHLSLEQLDTFYTDYVVCKDTLILEFHNETYSHYYKVVQIGNKVYLTNFERDYYIAISSLTPMISKLSANDWNKTSRLLQKKGYNYQAVYKKSKRYSYEVGVNTHYDYKSSYLLGKHFRNLFHPSGIYKIVNERNNGEEDKISQYQYEYDPSCICAESLKDFRLRDTMEVEYPLVTYDYELLQEAERKYLTTFSAFDISKQLFDPTDFSNQPTYIDIWASWCIPCRKEMPYLKELYDKYHSKGLNIVSLSLDQAKDTSKWEKVSKELGISWNNWFVKGGFDSVFAKALQVKGIPRYILIDKYGKIANANAPRPSDGSLEELLNQLLAEQ